VKGSGLQQPPEREAGWALWNMENLEGVLFI